MSYQCDAKLMPGTFILSLLVPSDNDRLGTASNAAASPWVIAIQLSGIKALPHIISMSISCTLADVQTPV